MSKALADDDVVWTEDGVTRLTPSLTSTSESERSFGRSPITSKNGISICSNPILSSTTSLLLSISKNGILILSSIWMSSSRPPKSCCSRLLSCSFMSVFPNQFSSSMTLGGTGEAGMTLTSTVESNEPRSNLSPISIASAADEAEVVVKVLSTFVAELRVGMSTSLLTVAKEVVVVGMSALETIDSEAMPLTGNCFVEDEDLSTRNDVVYFSWPSISEVAGSEVALERSCEMSKNGISILKIFSISLLSVLSSFSSSSSSELS